LDNIDADEILDSYDSGSNLVVSDSNNDLSQEMFVLSQVEKESF